MNTLVLLCALLFAPPTPPKPAPKPTPPPPVLQGTVKGPDAKPIEKAFVLVRPVAGRSGEPPLTTRTDAAGAFRIALPAPGLVHVRVEAPGLAPRSFERYSPITPLVVVLAKGQSIEGVVRDGTTQQPIAGARVEVRAGTGLPWDVEAGLVEALTDKKGAFRLDGLASGTHTVMAAARGYGRASRPSVAAGGRAELFLFPGASVRGVVKDPQDRPVAGAVVRAEGGARFSGSRLAARATDASGRFELLGVDPGTYQLLAHHKDWAVGVVGDVVVERQGDVDVDIRLEAGKRVTGRLVDADERPVAGRVAFDTLAGEGPLRAAGELLRAEAGPDGRFTVERLPSGDHMLATDARGYGAKRVDVQVRAADREVALGDVVLEAGAVIRGRVRDKAGLGIASANIFGFPASGMRGGGSVEVQTAADGTFVLAGLQAGSYRLNVRAPGYGSTGTTALTGAENVDIVLEPAGSITGVVVDEAGRVVESFAANANPTRRDPGIFISRGRDDDNDRSDGTFNLLDLAAGEYVVEVTAPEKGRGVVSGVKVTAGISTDVGRVTIKAGGVVRGQVVDAGGAPVPGASVTVGSAAGFGPGERATSSDASGSFEVRGVTPGTATASAAHPNYAPGHATGLEVDPARPVEARIVLTQGGRIDGTARRRGNQPIVGSQVRVFAERSAAMRFDPGTPAVTGPDGSFVLEHVPAGRVRVMLMAREGSTLTSSQTREVEVQEGQTTVVEFSSRDIVLSGTVTRGGQPSPGVRLRLRGDGASMMMSFGPPGTNAPPTGPQRMVAVTREDGRYEMLVDEPGRFRVHFEPAQGGSLPSRTVEVPDAESFSSDFDFSGIQITGVVIDKDTEQPIGRAEVHAYAKERAGGSSDATTGADGRFQLEVDAGEYRLSANADGYGRANQEVSVSASGASDVRLLLTRGASLRGKVQDVRGRPASDVRVSAVAAGNEGPGGFGSTLADGSFTIEGLPAGSYVLFAGERSGVGYGMAGPVNAGAAETVVRLRPAGHVQVTVLGPEGAPVKDARAIVRTANGHRVGGPLLSSETTGADGLVTLDTIAGTLEIEAHHEKLRGKATVAVQEGGTAAVEITLHPGTPKK